MKHNQDTSVYRKPFTYLVCNMRGCAIGISDYGLAFEIHAQNEDQTMAWGDHLSELHSEEYGLPPHGIFVSAEEIQRNSNVLFIEGDESESDIVVDAGEVPGYLRNASGRMALASALSQPGDWRHSLLALESERLIGVTLTACSNLMLPYWSSHYENDDNMDSVVSTMNLWAKKSTAESQKRIHVSLERVAVEFFGHMSPICPTPTGSDCPGDYAGDSIVAAANAITEIGESDFHNRAEASLNFAVQVVVEMMVHRQPDDELTDFQTRALERLRKGIIKLLRSWNLYMQ
jgi:hypothetical protein